ncbi:MetS family NSS transporter small subunit [Mollicutes bacterium LVI A0039]|nr:MetS family NSS transporter small subunit [Mollicutes bacterium LVI A0039]
MTTQAIVFMLIGLSITWGGLLLAVSIQVKHSKKNNK